VFPKRAAEGIGISLLRCDRREQWPALRELEAQPA